jgi:hypothetical protein
VHCRSSRSSDQVMTGRVRRSQQHGCGSVGTSDDGSSYRCVCSPRELRAMRPRQGRQGPSPLLVLPGRPAQWLACLITRRTLRLMPRKPLASTAEARSLEKLSAPGSGRTWPLSCVQSVSPEVSSQYDRSGHDAGGFRFRSRSGQRPTSATASRSAFVVEVWRQLRRRRQRNRDSLRN